MKSFRDNFPETNDETSFYNEELLGLEFFNNEYSLCRPKLSELLDSLKLNISYCKASGNYLYSYEEHDNDLKCRKVSDFVSGYGSALLGHNHPEIKQALVNSLVNDVPMMAQCAIRPAAAKLAKKLNELHPSKHTYYCNFTNSGTESVEAAIKHAYKVRFDFLRNELKNNLCKLNDFVNNYTEEIQLPGGFSDIIELKNYIIEHNTAQLENFKNKPVIVAFEGSFHGKTSSSLKVTSNKTLREDFEGLSSLQTFFIDIEKTWDLVKIVDNNFITLFEIEEETPHKIKIKKNKHTKAIAFIFEIILGEGGIHVVHDSTLRELAALHPVLKVPYIVDEVQTGSGRTGSFFAYTQTPLEIIEPEYITLSKALGGGMVKIGVTLIHEKEYDPEFGLLHTSTFAEDEISCEVALKTIEILTRDDDKLMKQIKEKGQYLLNKLYHLKLKYPDIVKDIRGRGLMIGLEISSLDNFSPFFRYAGSQGFIALLIASYLLFYHNIRILSPLTTMFKANPGKRRKAVIRIQPPAGMSRIEMIKLVDAFDEVFNIIKNSNEFVLLAHLINAPIRKDIRKAPEMIPVLYHKQKPKNKVNKRVGFVVHITELKYLIEYYFPSFNCYEYKDRAMIKWWNKICRFLDPDLMHRTYIKANNQEIEVNIVCVPYLPKYMMKTYGEAKIETLSNKFKKILLEEMQTKIQDAAEYIYKLGINKDDTYVVGLGAFNSIVTDNGNTLYDLDFPATTGNAYTTALMYQGILQAIEKKKQDAFELSAAIIGAAGNIGTAISQLLSIHVKKLYLIGKDMDKSYERLIEVKRLCLQRVLKHLGKTSNQFSLSALDNLQGITADVTKKIIEMIKQKKHINGNLKKLFFAYIKNMIRDIEENKKNKEIDILMNTLGIDPASHDVLGKCDIVTIATNSTDAWLIRPENVKKGAIVCCASVPSNLSTTFKDYKDKYFVFDGGYAQLPENNEINFVGMPKHGNIYGCLAETILLAFDDCKRSFAKGQVSIEKVLQIIDIADKYEFKLGKFTLGESIHRMMMT